MSKPLPEVLPLDHLPQGEGELSNADLYSLLAGLQPGWYDVASLWPRYLVWAENAGRLPVKRISLGMNLRRISSDQRRGPKGGANQYRLTREHVSRTVSGDPVG